MTSTLVRSPALTPNQKADAVHTLYSLLPEVGQESENFSIEKWAENTGAGPSQMRDIVRHMEMLNILSRRFVWEANGKQSYWTLLIPEAQAQEMLNDGKNNFAIEREHKSLRQRILTALQNHGPFENVHDILLYIREPNETLDLHNMTHVLQALRQQGKVAFKVTSSGRRGKGKGNRTDNVPHSIMLRESNHATETIVIPEPVKEEVTQEIPQILTAVEEQYPLIMRVVMRQEFLQRAAFLASEGGEDEIGTILLEKAEKPLNPFEEEVIKLWNAYQEKSNGRDE